MDKTKTLNAKTNSTNVDASNEPSMESENVHAPNEPSHEYENLNTENVQPSSSGVTVFRPITKANWKRKHDVDSDSDSSHDPTEEITSDHSSDHVVSDQEFPEINDFSYSYELSIPEPENDILSE